MMSDNEISFLQRSIASNRQKQEETISQLRFEVTNLNSIVSKHQEQHAALKERLVKVMTEFEMRGVLLDAEKEKNTKLSVQLEQAEGREDMLRQEKESLRKRLIEAEALAASAAHTRTQMADLETALQHAREQVRLLSDNKSALDSQLQVTNRDLEGNRWKYGSLESRLEIQAKEKAQLQEEVADLKQALAKVRGSHAEEMAETRRELQRASDSYEAERTKRLRSEAAEEAMRRAEEETRRLLAEALTREREAHSLYRSTQDEGLSLRQAASAIRSSADEKEAQRLLEVERRQAVELERSRMELLLDAKDKSLAELQEKYEALRSEGRGCRQQVLEAVAFLADLLGLCREKVQALDAEQSYLNEYATASAGLDGSWLSAAAGPQTLPPPSSSVLLMLSPRGRAAAAAAGRVRGGGVGGTMGGSLLSPMRGLSPMRSGPFAAPFAGPGLGFGVIFSSEAAAHAGNANHMGGDPFDQQVVLHGLAEALCLPDLRSTLQAARDMVEWLVTNHLHPQMPALPAPAPTQSQQTPNQPQSHPNQHQQASTIEVLDSSNGESDRIGEGNDRNRIGEGIDRNRIGEGIDRNRIGEGNDRNRHAVKDVNGDGDGGADGGGAGAQREDAAVASLRQTVSLLQAEVASLRRTSDEDGNTSARAASKRGEEWEGQSISVTAGELVLAGESGGDALAALSAERQQRLTLQVTVQRQADDLARALSRADRLAAELATATANYKTASAALALAKKRDNEREAIVADASFLSQDSFGPGLGSAATTTAYEEGDGVPELRSKLRRADRHYAVICRAVEQLEGELRTQGDQYASSLALSEAKIKALQRRLETLRQSGGLDAEGETAASADPLHHRLLDFDAGSGAGIYDQSTVAYQAVEKLRVRSAVRGKIVAIYRQCLFSLRDGAVPAPLPMARVMGLGVDSPGALGDSGEAKRAGEEAAGQDDPVVEFTSSRTALQRSLQQQHQQAPLGLGSARVGPPLSGPPLVAWLDEEISALRLEYEGEVRSLEAIVRRLREQIRELQQRLQDRSDGEQQQEIGTGRRWRGVLGASEAKVEEAIAAGDGRQGGGGPRSPSRSRSVASADTRPRMGSSEGKKKKKKKKASRVGRDGEGDGDSVGAVSLPAYPYSSSSSYYPSSSSLYYPSSGRVSDAIFNAPPRRTPASLNTLSAAFPSASVEHMTAGLRQGTGRKYSSTSMPFFDLNENRSRGTGRGGGAAYGSGSSGGGGRRSTRRFALDEYLDDVADVNPVNISAPFAVRKVRPHGLGR